MHQRQMNVASVAGAVFRGPAATPLVAEIPLI
jgi:hypothetical protein